MFHLRFAVLKHWNPEQSVQVTTTERNLRVPEFVAHDLGKIGATVQVEAVARPLSDVATFRPFSVNIYFYRCNPPTCFERDLR